LLTSSLHIHYEKLGVLEPLCIAFFDLTDSTHLKKQLGESRGVEMVMLHNREAASICGMYKGRVIKHIGDAILVVFNTPLEGMLAALDFIGKIHGEKLPFRTKIGLIQGIVTRIDINGTDFLGHAVDRCAKLIGHALPNQVLTDHTTMQLIGPFLKEFEQVVTRFLGIRQLKGIGKVPVYEMALTETGFINETGSVPDLQEDLLGQGGEKARPTIPAPLDKIDLPPLSIPTPPETPVADPPLERVLNLSTPTGSDLDSVSVGYQNIKHILDQAYDLNIRQVFLSGSFARGAMIRPLHTIDVMAVMAPPREKQDSVTQILQQLKGILAKGSPGSNIEMAVNQVIITQKDIAFGIIPVLVVLENGQGRLMIPCKEGGFWIARNPAMPDQWMEQAATRNGPSFLPFLRLIKAWQKVNCSYINSFHLELLTDMIASKIKLDLSFESVYQWFWYTYNFMNQNKKPFIREPRSTDVYADEYIYANSITFNRFSRILTDSYNLARQGIIYHRAGEHKMAMTRWKVLFGTYIE